MAAWINMVLITTLNPCIDKTLFVPQYQKGRIIKVKKVKVIAGGKGNNVARILNHLGIKNVVLNFLGGHYGKIIEDCLKKDKIDYRAVWTAHPSRTVVTVLEKDLKQTAFAEPGPKILDAEKQAMHSLFQKTLQTYKHGLKAVVLSGSVPDQNCISLVQEMAAYAKSNAVKALLDSSGPALRAGLQSPNLFWSNPISRSWETYYKTLPSAKMKAKPCCWSICKASMILQI